MKELAVDTETTIRVVAKLMELTRTGKLSWYPADGVTLPTGAQGSTFIQERSDVFTAEFGSWPLRIFRRTDTDQTDRLKGGSRYGSRVALQLGPLWSDFPYVIALEDLYGTVLYQITEVGDFIGQLLSE